MDVMVNCGFPSFKVFTTFKKAGFYSDDYALLKLLEASRETGSLVMVHAENDALVEGVTSAFVSEGKVSCRYHGLSRPGIAEIEAVSRCIILAEAAQSPLYIVHNSMPECITMLSDARSRGVAAIAECCPQYLTLDDSVFDGNLKPSYVLSDDRSKIFYSECDCQCSV
ncbi:MAG: hypothetical protein AB1798_13635 [Spirochaetota bacterium]